MFAINAVTYVFAVIGLVWARYPRYAARARMLAPVEHRLLSGVRIARADPVIRYVLLTLFSFSFFSVTFVGIMPLVAKYNLGIRRRASSTACCTPPSGSARRSGALTVGSVLAQRSKVALLRPGFVAFAIALGGVRPRAQRARGVHRRSASSATCTSSSSRACRRSCRSSCATRSEVGSWRCGSCCSAGRCRWACCVAGPFAKSYSTEVLLVGAVWALVLACCRAPGPCVRKVHPMTETGVPAGAMTRQLGLVRRDAIGARDPAAHRTGRRDRRDR